MVTHTSRKIPEMRPHLAKGKSPPFYELDAYTFQDICTELLREEPGVVRASVFGDQGQQQYGIDIKADRQDDELEVGQCKRYKTLNPPQIISASNEFLEYWGTYWKEKGVTRFILLVTCDVTKTQNLEEIDRQKMRFKQIGIAYELWDARSIERKLRPHSAIVSKYCHPSDYWVNEICGTGVPVLDGIGVQTQVSAVVDTLIANKLSEFASRITETELQNIRNLWQEGRETEALASLDGLQQNQDIWISASSELKARTLCFQATIALERGSDKRIVEGLLDEAKAYATTPNEARVRALLLRRQGKTEEALQLLEDVNDVDTRNLRAALLLETGKQLDAVDSLQDILLHGLATAETHRILALCQLVSGNLADADASIKQARSIEPTWVRLKMIEAIIAYYRSLSPLVTPKKLEAFPLPIDWMFVKLDQDSVTSLRAAEQAFKHLLEDRSRIVEDTYLVGWRLASLLNDSERQAEGLAFCRRVLDENPTCFPAIAWATFRRLDIDFARSLQVLQDKIATEDYSLEDAVGLVTIYAHEERFTDGLELLQSSRERFLLNHIEPLWIMWHVQMLLGLGKFDKLAEVEAALPATDEYEPLRELFVNQRAIHSGQWDDFIDHNFRKFAASHEAGYLLDACIALYQNEKWDTFSDYAEKLIELVGTATVYRYSIFSAYQAHRYEQCLQLITHWKDHFLLYKHQHEFDQLSIACLRSLGKFPEAIAEAKSLVEINPSVTNVMNLVSLLYEIGDYYGVSVYAAWLIDAEIQPEDSLQLAQFLQGENDPLAQRFWRKATAAGLPDEYLGSALDLAFQLGLDNETGDLYPKLLGYNAQGGQTFQRIETKDDFLKIAENIRRKNAEYDEAYRSGVLPVHFYIQELNLTLSDLFHDEFHDKQLSGELLRSRPLYVRYGGRPMLDGFAAPVPDLRIFMDISALLLAAQLNILPEVEQAFAPLFIPSEVFRSIAYMVSKTFHHQPSAIEANKAILRLVAQKKLKVVRLGDIELVQTKNVDPDIASLSPEWTSCLRVATAKNGYFLTHLPPTKLGKRWLTEPVHPPMHSMKYLLNCKTVAHSLRDRGEITRDTYKAAIHALGNMAANYPNVPTPQRGTFVLCDDSITHTLVNSGLLEPLCRVFNVHITQQNLEIAQGATTYDADRQESRNWLHELQIRLRDGIRTNQYRVLPAQDNDDPEITDTTSRAMLALIKYADQLQEKDVVWIDDRFCSHFSAVGKAQTVGVIDILKFLVGKGRLSEERYFECLTELRAGNVRYVPLETDELQFQLRSALRENDGKFSVESTRPLVVAAKYLAACVAQREDLQIPPVPEQITNSSGEIEFFLGTNRVLQHTLFGIWLSISDPDARRAMAEWIIDKLYLDYPSLFLKDRHNLPVDEADYYRAGAQFASFLSSAYFDTREIPEGNDPYPDYVEWLLARLFGRRLHTEPAFLDIASKVIKQTLLQTKTENLSDLPQNHVNRAIQRYIVALPLILRMQVEADNEFLIQVGVKPESLIPAISVDDVDFSQGEFWKGVATAINGDKCAIRAKSPDTLVWFSRQDDEDKLLVCFDHPKEEKRVCLNQPELRILVEDVAEQTDFLRSYRFTFDYGDDEFQHVEAELTGIGDPVERIQHLYSFWEQSAYIQYRDLSQKIQPGQSLDLPAFGNISFDSLLRYLRLNRNTEERDHSVSVVAATEFLLQELGVEAAFQRLGGIPAPLPDRILESIEALPIPERMALIHRLVRQPRSIISRIHLLRLLCRYRQDDESFMPMAIRLVEYMMSAHGREEIEAFCALVAWIHQQFILRAEFSQYSAKAKAIFVWTHAEKVFSIFISARFDHNWMKEAFTNDIPRMSVEALLPDHEYWNDVTHPRFAQYERIVAAGLLHAFDSEYDQFPSEAVAALVELTFPVRAAGVRFPAFHVLLNTQFLNNTCDSFLFVDLEQKLKSLLDETDLEIIQFPKFEALIDDAIIQISSDNVDEQSRLAAWAILYSIVRDVALPEALNKRLSHIFESVDWVDAFTTDRQIWTIAFQTVIAQYPWLKSRSLQDKLHASLLQIAEKCAATEHNESEIDTEWLDQAAALLLEGALRTAVSPSTGEVSLATFGQSAIDLSVRWKRIQELCTAILRVMCEDLPLPYAQQLWTHLVILRAI